MENKGVGLFVGIVIAIWGIAGWAQTNDELRSSAQFIGSRTIKFPITMTKYELGRGTFSHETKYVTARKPNCVPSSADDYVFEDCIRITDTYKVPSVLVVVGFDSDDQAPDRPLAYDPVYIPYDPAQIPGRHRNSQLSIRATVEKHLESVPTVIRRDSCSSLAGSDEVCVPDLVSGPSALSEFLYLRLDAYLLPAL